MSKTIVQAPGYKFPDDELGQLASGAIAEYQSDTPEGQAAFRMSICFAFTAGFLSSIQPDQKGHVDPERAAVRERVRDRLREYIAANPDTTALDKLRAGQAALVDEYDSLSSVDPAFEPEADLARGTQHWGLTRPDIVDEQFAQATLEYIEL